MSECHTPLIICRLTDRNGKLVSPSAPGAVTFTPLYAAKKCFAAGETKNSVPVLIRGYVVVYVEGRDLSPPVPFSAVEHVCISARKGTFLDFTVLRFCCIGIPVTTGEGSEVAAVAVSIEIDAAVRSCADADVWVRPAACPDGMPERVCISVKRVFDRVCLRCETSAVYEMLLQAAVSQYNTRSDGTKRHYTNADELTEYGGAGILSPGAVSCYILFINGMLQPRVNYGISEGSLELLTTDVPPAGEVMMITFFTFGTNHGRPVSVTNDTYVAISTGVQRVFTNADERTEYGDRGIPAPDGVSHFNLYVNGALQPEENYVVSEGRLELTTSDLPPAGAAVILESIVIQDSDGRLLRAQSYAYNARSQGNKIYTDRDEIVIYAGGGILDPRLSSYQNLFVNGVIQPQINYSVRSGMLTLNTQDAPQEGSPVTLESMQVFVS